MLCADSERDFICGDLLEEYSFSVLPERGAAYAGRWYWNQVWRSTLFLLLFPRHQPVWQNVKSSLFLLASLVATVVVGTVLLNAFDFAVHALFPNVPMYHNALLNLVDCVISWLLLACARTISAMSTRHADIRPISVLGLLFFAAFVVPSMLGISPPLRPWPWVLLCGAPIAITLGAAMVIGLRRS